MGAAIAMALCIVLAASGQSLDDAVAALKRGDAAAACQTLQQLAQQQPDEAAVHYWYGRALLKAGKLAEAESQLRRAVQLKADSAESWYWLGQCLLQRGRPADAAVALRRALALNPKLSPARSALSKAEALQRHGQAAGGPPNHRIRVRVEKGSLDIGTLDLVSSNVLDYTFSYAPTDWYVAGGIWGTTNRWTCSPEWSWFGGLAELAPAAVWSKHVFDGDITVDMYAAFGMLLRAGGRSYKCPSDLNITICGDGLRLDSGYTFLVGGFRNNRTAILKNGRVLAETSDPKALLPMFEDGYPSMYEFHRKWWGIRARKHGSVLELYKDDKLILRATDPDPLPGGRVALWTYDNRMIIARVKIYYERLAEPDAPPIERLAMRPVERLGDRLRLELPFCRWNDFESDLGSLKPLVATPAARELQKIGALSGASIYEGGPFTGREVLVTLDSGGPTGRGHCAKIINRVTGGLMAVALTDKPFRVADLPILEFDYRIPPTVKVNLYVAFDGLPLYEILLTGHERGAEIGRVIGRIPDARADGKWHHARIDLLALLSRALGPGAAASFVKALWIGNMAERDYLLAGFGANFLGTAYWLDNLVLYRPVSTVRLDRRQLGAGPSAGLAAVLDNRPDTVPTVSDTVEGETVELKPTSSGWQWLHLRLQTSSGPQILHARVPCDLTPPRASLLSPRGGRLGDEEIVLRLSDEPFGAIDWTSLQLEVAGNKLGSGSPGVQLQPDRAAVAIDPAAAGISLSAEASVPVKISHLADLAGNQPPSPASWKLAFSPRQDRTPPRIKLASIGPGPLIRADFEHGLDGFQPYGSATSALLVLDDREPGNRCLRVVNPRDGGAFGIRLLPKPFNAGIFRLVSFDYCIPPHLRADFAVYVNGDWKGIKFTDTDNNIGYIGRVPNVQADGKWHHADFDLYQMLVRDDPTAPSYRVSLFVLADWGPARYNFRRREYWLDNFTIAPVVGPRTEISVAAADISGLSGISWAIDTLASVAAPNSPMAHSPSAEVSFKSDGLHWIAVRAFDAAGNASQPIRLRAIVDTKRPRASIISPAPASRQATSLVRLALSDSGPAGIDPASVVLEINGKKYRCTKPGLTYDARRGELVWNCEQVRPPVVFADGQEVRVRLLAASDFAGNEVLQKPEWSWTMDYRLDRKPPTIARITSPTHPTLALQTFEEDLGAFAPRGGSAAAKVERDNSTAAGGRWCVKLTQVRRGALMQAYAWRQPYNARRYPVIAFDYCFDPGLRLDMMVYCSGGWYAIAMTGTPAGTIGVIPGIKADGKWHHAAIDVYSLLRRRLRDRANVIQAIIFTDRGGSHNKVGATARFDNFIIGAVGAGRAKVTWWATDTTGIAGFSYALDRSPSTVPPAKVMTKGLSLDLGPLDPGIWYFHIRALDGAGNWGPAAHYAILHKTAG